MVPIVFGSLIAEKTKKVGTQSDSDLFMLVAGHGFEPWTSGYSSVITPDDDATNRESCHSSYLDSSVTTLMAINEDAPVIQQYEQAREQ